MSDNRDSVDAKKRHVHANTSGGGAGVIESPRDIGATPTGNTEAASTAASDIDAAEQKEKNDDDDEEEDDNNAVVEFTLPPSVQERLVCKLCGGFYRNPYTVTKCLHTYCRGCLFLAIERGDYDCVLCGTYLGKDARKFSLPDRVLQAIIDKVLFPDIAAEDARKEADFYRARGIERKPKAGTTGTSKREKRSAAKHGGDSQIKTTSENIILRLVPDEGEDETTKRHGKRQRVEATASESCRGNQRKPPSGTPPPLPLPFLRTDGAIRIGQLKKYLGLKLGNTQPGSADERSVLGRFEVLHDGVVLGNEVSVNFILRTVWMGDPTKPLLLMYRYAK